MGSSTLQNNRNERMSSAFVPAPSAHRTQSLRSSTNSNCQMIMFAKEQGTMDSPHQGYQMTDEHCDVHYGTIDGNPYSPLIKDS